MEALKAESERSKEEKQRITEQLLLQHMDLESHCQVSRRLYPLFHNVGIEFSSGILHLNTESIGFISVTYSQAQFKQGTLSYGEGEADDSLVGEWHLIEHSCLGLGSGILSSSL